MGLSCISLPPGLQKSCIQPCAHPPCGPCPSLAASLGGQVSVLAPSSSGSGSWSPEPRAGRSSRSPWWCAPAPPAAGRAPAPPLTWTRSCSKSSRSGGVSWWRCQTPCPSCRPRCRCCRYCCLDPAGISSEDAADSLCGKRSSSPRRPGWAPARCTHRRQSTGLLAQGFLQEEAEAFERCRPQMRRANRVPGHLAHCSPHLEVPMVTNSAFLCDKLHTIFKTKLLTNIESGYRCMGFFSYILATSHLE